MAPVIMGVRSWEAPSWESWVFKKKILAIRGKVFVHENMEGIVGSLTSFLENKDFVHLCPSYICLFLLICWGTLQGKAL